MADNACSRTGIVQLTVGAALISFSPVLVKLAHVGPAAAGFYRCLFGGIILTAAALAAGQKLRQGRALLGISVGCGLFFALDLFLYHHSIGFIGPGLSTIVTNFQVFYVALFGALVLKERPGWRFAAAVPLAFAGLLIMIGFQWQGLTPDTRAGLLYALAAGGAYACYILTLRRAQSVASRPAPLAIMALVSITSTVILLGTTRAAGESFRIPDLQSWICLIAYGLFGQVIGWVLISKALPRVEASRASLLLLLQPALAFIWDVALFGRSASARELTGAALAIGAIYLGSLRRRRALPPRPA